MSDALERLRRGDPDALDRFCADHAEQVLTWVIALGGPWADAEDVAQDVLEVALRKLGTFRGDAAVSTWLYGIARNVIWRRRRRHRLLTWLGLEQAADRAAPEPLADEALSALQQRRLVQHALEQLGDVHREVLVLCELDGRPATEVAAMLGVPVGTIYSRLHHGRRQLATVLARLGVRPEATSPLVVVSDRGRR